MNSLFQFTNKRWFWQSSVTESDTWNPPFRDGQRCKLDDLSTEILLNIVELLNPLQAWKPWYGSWRRSCERSGHDGLVSLSLMNRKLRLLTVGTIFRYLTLRRSSYTDRWRDFLTKLDRLLQSPTIIHNARCLIVEVDLRPDSSYMDTKAESASRWVSSSVGRWIPIAGQEHSHHKECADRLRMLLDATNMHLQELFFAVNLSDGHQLDDFARRVIPWDKEFLQVHTLSLGNSEFLPWISKFPTVRSCTIRAASVVGNYDWHFGPIENALDHMLRLPKLEHAGFLDIDELDRLLPQLGRRRPDLRSIKIDYTSHYGQHAFEMSFESLMLSLRPLSKLKEVTIPTIWNLGLARLHPPLCGNPYLGPGGHRLTQRVAIERRRITCWAAKIVFDSIPSVDTVYIHNQTEGLSRSWSDQNSAQFKKEEAIDADGGRNYWKAWLEDEDSDLESAESDGIGDEDEGFY